MASASSLRERVENAWRIASESLLAERNSSGYWEGELSSSALSTATAITALAIFDRAHKGDSHAAAIARGARWLIEHQNEDGGWGDTIRSISNISTTALCWAALGFCAPDSKPLARAEQWLESACAGRLLPDAIIARYGKDRTFSVPILTMCALAGRLGQGRAAWTKVIPLPFELAALPASWFAALRLPVVSYALPALIAIGQARHYFAPSSNPVARFVRERMREKTLHKLATIQPTNGGFLEATPLTSFVTMSLAGAGNEHHAVTLRGVKFLEQAQCADGSWPIDTNLATWCSTLSLNAFTSNYASDLNGIGARPIKWIAEQQYRVLHPYTNAPPGAWAWTDLPGGVPDADDTAGALLALANYTQGSAPPEVELGLKWLLDLQNRDSGIPTFCRGWTNLPFDRSSPDITAHSVRAWLAWHPRIQTQLQTRVTRAVQRAFHFLLDSQAHDGSWSPLWFGNQHRDDELNPVYGTARVLSAFSAAPSDSASIYAEAVNQALEFLLNSQHANGSWGGISAETASTEESALAIEALAEAPKTDTRLKGLERGLAFLIARVEDGSWKTPAPIGFYFAKLWYFERLYPQIFTVAALQRARTLVDH